MKKLGNTEAELQNSVAYKKMRVALIQNMKLCTDMKLALFPECRNSRLSAVN